MLSSASLYKLIIIGKRNVMYTGSIKICLNCIFSLVAMAGNKKNGHSSFTFQVTHYTLKRERNVFEILTTPSGVRFLTTEWRCIWCWQSEEKL